MPARGLVDVLTLHDVTHRERGPHEARARKGGLQYRCADDTGNAQLVHHVGNNASRISKGAKPFDDSFWWPRHFHHANTLAGDFPSQLFSAIVASLTTSRLLKKLRVLEFFVS